MKKIVLISFLSMLLSLLYVTPLWGKNNVMNISNIECSIEDIKTEKKENLTLYTGVEEALSLTTEESKIKDETTYIGWTSSRLNIRKTPSLNSDIVDILEYNEKLEYQIHNRKWAKINYNNEIAYVYREFISDVEHNFRDYLVPENRGFKSYMSYKAITNKDSKQYKIQKNYAYTGNYGIRMVKNRYCIAIGTYFDAPIGTYVDLILENGIIIPCIVSEIKSNKDTNIDNIVTSHNGCVAEFLVDTDTMNENAKRDGDISSCDQSWDSPVCSIKVYQKNILN